MRKAMNMIPIILLAALCGCQETLYSNLEEKEATGMMATLMEKGVGCGKKKSKEGWDVSVDKSDLPSAVRILERDGFPRHDFQNMGEVFGSKGLISSPQEDRIRFIFALSQEIAETISQIDGVLTSRVHLVLPENDPLSDSLKPSSASVFVKYLPSSQVPRNTIQIKQLVLNGVEGLSMDKVSVVAMPGTNMEAVAVPAMSIGGVQLYRNSMATLFGIAAGGSVLMLGIGYLAALMIRQRAAAGKPILNLGKAKQPAGGLAKL